ncbi:MAG TPA: MFS transporter [Anaerolineales bacterium]|nr:MFS transporter [Anaerolineales bacterium]
MNRLRFLQNSGLPSTYWFLWAGTIVNRLGGFVVPFLTLYLTQRGVPIAQAALMVSLFGAGSFAASLVGGELSDRLGRRPVMLISFFVAPVAMLVLGFAETPGVIAVTTLLLGFFTDLYRPAVSAAIVDMVPPDNRPRAFGYLYWAINVGFAIAPVLAGYMASRNYLLLFIGDALTTFAFGLIVLWGVRETRPAELESRPAVPLRERVAGLRSAPLLLAFAGLALFFGIVYAQGHVTLPLDMSAAGLSPENYGLAIAINGGLIVILGIPASNAAPRWPRYRAMTVSAVLVGIGFGIPALASTLPVYALSVAIWTLGEIGGATIAPSIVADLSPPDKRGLYQGIFGSAWGLAFFIGPVLGGWIYENLGGAALWGLCFATALAVAVGFQAMARPAARHAQADPSTG